MTLTKHDVDLKGCRVYYLGPSECQVRKALLYLTYDLSWKLIGEDCNKPYWYNIRPDAEIVGDFSVRTREKYTVGYPVGAMLLYRHGWSDDMIKVGGTDSRYTLMGLSDVVDFFYPAVKDIRKDLVRVKPGEGSALTGDHVELFGHERVFITRGSLDKLAGLTTDIREVLKHGISGF